KASSPHVTGQKECVVLDTCLDLIKVFTTRPDTIFGATYMVLAPQHPMVEKITTQEQKAVVEEYVKKTQKVSESDRVCVQQEKTGVFTGSYCLNPANNEKIPVWISDYVEMGYGTGAIMAVPAHDERDFEFAKKFDLPIKQVIKSAEVAYENFLARDAKQSPSSPVL
ncbi:MAG: class I tRNA ligase family protein, partial [Patescibacteria group bacterium]|nr:class I tRNA ligase family protein [Patescibacteria group bacterium]